MIYVLAITQMITALMVNCLLKDSSQKDKQILSLVAILHKKFGVIMPELAENYADYVKNNINLEEK